MTHKFTLRNSVIETWIDYYGKFAIMGKNSESGELLKRPLQEIEKNKLGCDAICSASDSLYLITDPEKVLVMLYIWKRLNMQMLFRT